MWNLMKTCGLRLLLTQKKYLEKNLPKTFSFFLWLMNMQMTDVPNRWAKGLLYWGDNTPTELFIARILYKEDLEQ